MKPPASPSEQDLLDLDAFIRSQRFGPGVFKTHGIDGLVTAIVIGPDMVMPSQWMPRIWSEREPEFEDMAEGERIIGLIMGLYNRVARSFDGDSSARFEPLYARMEEGPARKKALGQWCEGFIAGVAKHATWVEQRNRDATLEMMWPMVAVKAGGKLATPEVVAQIVPNVRRLHAHWLTFRRAAMPVVLGSPATPGSRAMTKAPGGRMSKTPRGEMTTSSGGPAGGASPIDMKIGRNDPCPCGSGLKFKKCCGGPGGTVH
jgi:uncharacterized protein